MNEEEVRRFIRIPWHVLLEVCSAYLLTKAEFDELTWDEFMLLYRRLRKRT